MASKTVIKPIVLEKKVNKTQVSKRVFSPLIYMIPEQFSYTETLKGANFILWLLDMLEAQDDHLFRPFPS